MHKHSMWLVTGIVSTILFIFIVFGVITKNNVITNFDFVCQAAVGSMVNPNATRIMSVVAFFGSPTVNIVLTILIAIVLWIIKDKIIALWIMCTQLGGSALAFIIKELVHRHRPGMQIIKDSGFSFPSGHTFNTAILVLIVMFIIVPKIQGQEYELVVNLLSIIWLFAVAFSRVYLRAHWPSDVVGSIALALAWWEIARILYFKFSPLLEKYLKIDNSKGRN
ncbi:phosphatase PAP2 family protein [Paucilactobacillus suebicus]|uniref:Phosphatase n=1 Tax=Paucilactobacillus suebicus DSM 5007 = KCTC 3549 TaxID=1423807 RepID=A0A0R1W5P2_9LACO|nr:phosphatase PAP2 family protein [Paucilactobacillus suebicus]KRM13137.1 phosphatase [Paucilactobacillus suebicus DSM 5007 = KCTC 3549]